MLFASYLFLRYSNRQNFLNDVGLILRRFLKQRSRKDCVKLVVGVCAHAQQHKDFSLNFTNVLFVDGCRWCIELSRNCEQ